MAVTRDGFGRIKRHTGNRSVRRMHLEGAARLVEEGKREPASFSRRVFNWLRNNLRGE